MTSQTRTHEHFTDEDWYAEDLSGLTFAHCTFTGVDMSEATARGARFTDCDFNGCRFNSATFDSVALVGCEFNRCTLTGTTLEGCKVAGVTFADCRLRSLRVDGGQWRGVILRGPIWADSISRASNCVTATSPALAWWARSCGAVRSTGRRSTAPTSPEQTSWGPPSTGST